MQNLKKTKLKIALIKFIKPWRILIPNCTEIYLSISQVNKRFRDND